jgi:hypothetical protein
MHPLRLNLLARQSGLFWGNRCGVCTVDRFWCAGLGFLISNVDTVHVTPALFVPLDPKLDDRVAGFVEVLGGVFSGRRVAAADVPASQA